MAISKAKKNDLVAEVSNLLADSKLTVFASYNGLSVADLQQLRHQAREAGVTIKVVKNRLVRVAMSANDTYKNTDTSLLAGQLLYAVSAEDEVSPAKVLDTFAKTNPGLEFVGAFGMEGEVISLQDIFLFKQEGFGTDGKVKGKHIATGAIPDFYQDLKNRGLDVDLSVFQAGRVL